MIKTISAQTVAAALIRGGAERATQFTAGAVVRKRDGRILIRYCAQFMTPRGVADKRTAALVQYRALLVKEAL